MRVGFAVVPLVFLATHVWADLQLSPEVEEYKLDGVKLKHVVFHDGEQRITYTPPRGWRYQGTGRGLVLQPPQTPQAEAIISVTKLPQPQAFDETTTKRLSDEVLFSVPNGATHVGIVSQEKNAVVIERKETLLVVISYDYFGVPYERSVMFLNRNNERLQFQLTSPQWNFKDLEKDFFSSQFSWQNL